MKVRPGSIILQEGGKEIQQSTVVYVLIINYIVWKKASRGPPRGKFFVVVGKKKAVVETMVVR